MLSLLNVFGIVQKKHDFPYLPRQIEMSGNIVGFSIPENFSRDFPVENLIETLDINDLSILNVGKSVELMRRWWDFYDNSFFSKNMGTMMMTVHAYRINDETKNISNPVEFVQSIQSDLERRDKEENSGRSEQDKVVYPSSYDSYVEMVFNKNKWIRNATGTMDDSQIVYHYWIPVSKSNYLAVEFHFAPNNNISMRSFIDMYCHDMLDNIMSTFDIVYSVDNPIKIKLESNVKLKLENLIQAIE